MTTLTQGKIDPSGAALTPNNFQFKLAYATLANMTSSPGVGMEVLNPYSPPYQTAMAAFNNGYLNPSQQNYPGNYYTISSAYGKDPVGKLTASRGCAASKVTVPAS
uniref:Uncharacterized protein n=1 Tax=viral metagenome TaxID=1070528 RepID=A0A6C0KS72_9ZZZZ